MKMITTWVLCACAGTAGGMIQLKNAFLMKNYVLYYRTAKKDVKGEIIMKHVKTLNTRKLQNTVKKVDAANVRHPASLLVRHPAQ